MLLNYVNRLLPQALTFSLCPQVQDWVRTRHAGELKHASLSLFIAAQRRQITRLRLLRRYRTSPLRFCAAASTSTAPASWLAARTGCVLFWNCFRAFPPPIPAPSLPSRPGSPHIQYERRYASGDSAAQHSASVGSRHITVGCQRHQLLVSPSFLSCLTFHMRPRYITRFVIVFTIAAARTAASKCGTCRP